MGCHLRGSRASAAPTTWRKVHNLYEPTADVRSWLALAYSRFSAVPFHSSNSPMLSTGLCLSHSPHSSPHPSLPLSLIEKHMCYQRA